MQEEAEEDARPGYIFRFTSKELTCSRAGAPVLRHFPKAWASLLSHPGSSLLPGVMLQP